MVNTFLRDRRNLITAPDESGGLLSAECVGYGRTLIDDVEVLYTTVTDLKTIRRIKQNESTDWLRYHNVPTECTHDILLYGCVDETFVYTFY